MRLPDSQWSKLMKTDADDGEALDEEARRLEEERELDEEDFKQMLRDVFAGSHDG